MDIQLLIGLGIGFIALIYLVWRFSRQFSHVEKDPKCEDCPVPENKQEAGNSGQ